MRDLALVFLCTTSCGKEIHIEHLLSLSTSEVPPQYKSGLFNPYFHLA